MNIDGIAWRSIWLEEGDSSICVIDQTKLPYQFTTKSLRTCKEVAEAITSMVVRGAPLIGVTSAYGVMLAMKKDPSDHSLDLAINQLIATRPTAINLRWAVERVKKKVRSVEIQQRASAAMEEAKLIEKEDVAMCEQIGLNGLSVFHQLLKRRNRNQSNKPLNVLTHCNAGWLATVDWGTALAPIYKAHREGLDIHVWVDETRPRNQGSRLTAYELGCEGIPHTLIVDNAGGYLMQNQLVDAVIVGADRVSSSGDVCNKIGTYLKAVAAKVNNIPFYVALPSSTIDWSTSNGFHGIPIEKRAQDEVTQIEGKLINTTERFEISRVNLSPTSTVAFNPAFDITPAKLITSLITDKGVLPCTKDGMNALLPSN